MYQKAALVLSSSSYYYYFCMCVCVCVCVCVHVCVHACMCACKCLFFIFPSLPKKKDLKKRAGGRRQIQIKREDAECFEGKQKPPDSVIQK